jgi:hypothetical protein
MQLSKRMEALVSIAIKKGRRYFPRPLPSIHDAADQESDFLYGVVWGLKKARKRTFKNDEAIVQFLINNGIWTVRRRRYYQMRRKLQIFCVCGKQLRMSQKPCHGTLGDRVVRARFLPIDINATDEMGRVITLDVSNLVMAESSAAGRW